LEFKFELELSSSSSNFFKLERSWVWTLSSLRFRVWAWDLEF
jgi:hypothetical protein